MIHFFQGTLQTPFGVVEKSKNWFGSFFRSS